MPDRGWLLVLATLVALPACVSHYRIHPREDPPTVQAWSDEVTRDGLRVRLEWARPSGEGPFAAVIVHPAAGKEASQLRGIARSLALEGYLAVAADYRRLPDGDVQGGSLFAWRGRDDPTLVLDLLRAHPDADPDRIGAMGYSQGGVYSLLIAAEASGSPRAVRAVVAYYPVTDFEYWLDDSDRRWAKRQVFKLIRRYFRRRSGAESDEEFSEFLGRASALQHAERIECPVLLIHGEKDKSAGVGESRRLERRLKELGREVELLEVEDAGHIFNFRDTEKAEATWPAALSWLDRHLKPAKPAKRP